MGRDSGAVNTSTDPINGPVYIGRGPEWVKAKDPLPSAARLCGWLTVYTYSAALYRLQAMFVRGRKARRISCSNITYGEVWASLTGAKSGGKGPVLAPRVADVIPLRGSEFWGVGYQTAGFCMRVGPSRPSNALYLPAVETF